MREALVEAVLDGRPLGLSTEREDAENAVDTVLAHLEQVGVRAPSTHPAVDGDDTPLVWDPSEYDNGGYAEPVMSKAEPVYRIRKP